MTNRVIDVGELRARLRECVRESKKGASIVVAAFMVLAMSPAPAWAQAMPPAQTPAQSAFLAAVFSQLMQGREVWITTSNGSRLKTRVTGLVPTGLTVTGRNEQGRTIRFEDVTRIEKATHRVRTHSMIGLGIGAGLASMGAAAVCDSGGCAAAFIVAYAGIGAGIGALNGAIKNSLNRDDDLIYDAGPRITVTMAVAPILSRTRKGVAVTLTWR